VSPAIAGGVVWSIGLLAFNDQVLPRANHRLKTLQDDISQAKPTFLLKEQVINSIAEGKYYLKAGKIDRAGGQMREVVIYDLGDPTRRRTIYADAGSIAFARNGTDLNMDLYRGQIVQVANENAGQLNRMFYDHDRITIRDVARGYTETQPEQSSRGDREMSVCEMQRRLTQAEWGYQAARREYEDALDPSKDPSRDATRVAVRPRPMEVHGIGWAYCGLIGMFGVREAHAADVVPVSRRLPATQDTVARGVARVNRTAPPRAAARRPAPPPAQSAGAVAAAIRDAGVEAKMARTARAAEAKLRLDLATRSRNRYEIEIHKKFSLAAACIIFVLVGAPIAVRFPRGGVGLVIGVSLLVFALYYVGLIGGESLANEGIVPPFWAMWGTNVILTAVGLVMLVRMGRDSSSGRGGDWGDRIDAIKARFGRGTLAAARRAA
jgi:lipopolysaccharide export system permease protein